MGENSKNSNSAPEDFFKGGGEMGERIRQFDWTNSPLGAIDGWQQSLKTAVRLMLDSRFSMFVWWGADLTYLYNDAYAPTLGAKHPAALGKSARGVWREIWADVGPQAEAVIERGEASWNEEMLLFLERRGFAEETYHTFSYSPITGDDGSIGGLFCAVSEETAKVINRRRLQSLRDLGERTLEESQTIEDACRAACETLGENPFDIPFALLYLLDADGKTARLYESLRAENDSTIAPFALEIKTEQDIWRFGDVLKEGGGRLMPEIDKKFAGKISAGAWDDDFTRQAYVVPLAKAGIQEFPAGFLVAGLSPRLEFDKEYRDFIELAAGHIATAIANARALEEERRRAESLAELDRAKTEFFSNVSHEFRTPLTLMLGNLEDVLQDGDAPNEREKIETAHRNSLRLLKLVNTLLDFSRIEANRQQADFVPTDLAKFTAELASNFRSAIEKAGIKLTVDCQPLSQEISIDREMWEKIVLNLISNAFKFTFAGEIKVSLTETGETAVLQISDTGTGIAPENLRQIFERFHRVAGAKSRTHEGTGIGLALVKELVKLHDGAISATSEIDNGTTFTISIPKARSGEAEKRSKGEKAAQASNAWQSYLLDSEAGETSESNYVQPSPFLPFAPSGSILLADDNADMREYVRRLLEQNGYRVSAVSNGEAALEVLEEDKPDLILSDVMMPFLDGFGLLEKIRADEQTREIPVILLSARAGEEAKVEGLDAGADDYLIKPFSAKELIARVDANLKLTRLRRESAERLREAQANLQRYRLLAEKATDVIWLIRPDGNIVEVNEAATKTYGYSREELLRMNVRDLREKSTVPLLDEQLKQANESGLHFETVHVRKDGAAFPVEINATGGDFGGERFLLSIVRDISERRRAEEALRGREAELREAQRVGSIGSWSWNAATDASVGSDELLRIYGFDPETDAVPNFADQNGTLYPSESWRQINEAVQKSLATGEGYEFDVPAFRKGGERIWITTRAEVVRDAAGKTIGLRGTVQDITARKRAEEVLAETANLLTAERERLNLALRTGALGAYEWRVGEDSVWWSPETYPVFGVAPESFTPTVENFNDLIHADDREEIWRKTDECVKRREVFTHEYRIVRRDGEIRWIFNQSHIGLDSNGNVERITGIAADITERKRAEEKLRRAARFDAFRVRLADALRGLSDAAEIQLATGRILGEELSANRVVYFEVRGENYFVERDYTNDAAPLAGGYPIDSFGERLLAAYRSGQAVWSADVAADEELSKDERAAYAMVQIGAYVSVPLVKRGEFVAGLGVHTREPHSWTADDIRLVEEAAERTWAAVTRARAEEALAKSEEKYRALFNSMDEGFTVLEMIFDESGKPVDYLHLENNPAQQRMTGIPDVTGRRVREAIPDIEDFWIETFGRVAVTGEAVRFENYLEGLDRWFDVFASRIGGAGSRQVALIYNDITDRKLAEQERERLLEREQELRHAAETANRLKDEFLATVSHELRTPLNAILGWSSMLQSGKATEEIRQRADETIYRSAKSQAQLIEDLLDVSRIITGKMRLEPRPVRLAALVESAIHTLRPAADAKSIRLDVNLECEPCIVNGDAQRLQQIVWNLISNAVKFTPDGGRVEVKLETQSSHVRLIVSDTGKGIEPEFLPFMFERFSQEDGSTTRRHGGLGLGLAIVRHLVELHGGKISAASAGINQGSTFTIELPLLSPGVQAEKSPDGKAKNLRESLSDGFSAEGNDAPKQLNGISVLLVDDELDTLELLDAALTAEGANVRVASSAADAFEIFEDWKPDVIVSDIAMPDEDGYSLIKRVRELSPDAGGRTPAIAMTAYVRVEDRMRVLKSGFQMYVPKPAEPFELTTAINNLVADKKSN